MNLCNKKVNLLLLFCFAFVSMSAQQSNSDNNDQPVKTVDATKNTYVADPAKSDNGDVSPQGHVPKNTYVAPDVVDNDGVKKVAEKKEPVEKTVPKTEVEKAPEVDLAAPTVEEAQDGSVEKASKDPKVVDANGDGQIDNPSVPNVKGSASSDLPRKALQQKAKEDVDGDGEIDKPASKKENN